MCACMFLCFLISPKVSYLASIIFLSLCWQFLELTEYFLSYFFVFIFFFKISGFPMKTLSFCLRYTPFWLAFSESFCLITFLLFAWFKYVFQLSWSSWRIYFTVNKFWGRKFFLSAYWWHLSSGFHCCLKLLYSPPCSFPSFFSSFKTFSLK